ncbi:MAG: hypothetical protein L3J18_08325 [Candidatus Brocadia sp.]|uniref:Uncharacterized protein n=1 Tax=Candidatus Brocadia fulgida TaxID=380242 RepID=A0A0M2UXX4_9BACT|nr:MAG: hypothetical protein BROFUL_00323 [Candidatus Brocadia fulgida]UJS22303.1 MAG: hypothetical protein L3J18_08325 [Candidatus Brocadia sp.]
MRKRFEQQRKLRVISISEVKLPLKSRDELPPILRALQHIYVTQELNEEAAKDQVKRYLGLARCLSEKIDERMLAIYGRMLAINQAAVCGVKLDRLEYFHRMLKRHIELVERMVVRGEQIPVEEKVYSLFEPHTEWLHKGKANKRVELGHNILVASVNEVFS